MAINEPPPRVSSAGIIPSPAPQRRTFERHIEALEGALEDFLCVGDEPIRSDNAQDIYDRACQLASAIDVWREA